MDVRNQGKKNEKSGTHFNVPKWRKLVLLLKVEEGEKVE